MIDEIVISQAEDVDATIHVVDKSGTDLPMDMADRVYVALKDGYGAIKAQFQSNGPSSGWYGIDMTDSNDGKLYVKVLTEVTKILKPGPYYWEVRVEYPSGAHVDDNKFNVGSGRPRYAFTVVDSALNKLSSLP